MSNHLPTTAALDDQTERVLLHTILEERPAELTRDELHARISGGDNSFGARDATERGLRDLRARGLVRVSRDRHLATVAAIRAAELLDPIG